MHAIEFAVPPGYRVSSHRQTMFRDPLPSRPARKIAEKYSSFHSKFASECSAAAVTFQLRSLARTLASATAGRFGRLTHGRVGSGRSVLRYLGNLASRRACSHNAACVLVQFTDSKVVVDNRSRRSRSWLARRGISASNSGGSGIRFGSTDRGRSSEGGRSS